MKEEMWKDIKGFEGVYKISSFGNVMSIRSNKMLSQKPGTKGYVKVTLCEKGLKSYRTVHRLVVEAFLDNVKNKPTVNHLNGIKDDNRLENLEWATYSENMQHAFDNGYKVPSYRDTSSISKLDSNDIFAVQVLIKRGITNKVIAELFNVSSGLISSVRKGKSI